MLDLWRAAFRWLWRQRIRLHLEGTGINPTPVDLHEQQLSLEQHSQAHRITTLGFRQGTRALALSGKGDRTALIAAVSPLAFRSAGGELLRALPPPCERPE